MKRKIVFISLCTLICVAVAVSGFSFARHRARANRKLSEKEQAAQNYRDFADVCLKEFPAENATQKIASLRHCVVMNSKFSASHDNTPLWQNWPKVTQMLVDRIEGKAKDGPPMECFYRAQTLRGILKTFGIEAHKVAVFKNQDGFDGHVVLEVMNPDTKKWEVHDALEDLIYVSAKDKTPLTFSQMLTMPVDTFQPCNFNGQCGWEQKSPEGFYVGWNKQYWNVAWYQHEKKLYVAKDRFDETKKRPVDGKIMSFCDYHHEWCNTIVHLETE